MAIENEDFVQSDDDFDDKKHEKLLDKVLGLNKAQQLKKASRTEPALQISEFDLAKSITGKKGVIHVGDLTNILQKKKTHVAIKKKVDNTSKISSTLPKPLEKIVTDRINRTVAYEKARLELDRWEPIVTANRVSNDLLFPLPVRDNEKNITLTKKWRLKTAFDIAMEKNNPQLVEEIHVDTTEEEKVKLTLEELKKMRGEQAKMRAHQSYLEAKARRQNKIKSKKYHRIQKKKKIKQTLKEFEELQKTNPEEALKKLEEIERIRAEERFTLRHKSTGKWAKNKQIRAKYDKESRAALAEQLRLSKELTQKTKAASDSEDEFVHQAEEKESLLALPIEKKRPQIDEPLIHNSEQEEPSNSELTDLNNILRKKNKNTDKNKVPTYKQNGTENNKVKEKKKVTELDTIIPDIITNMDEDDDDNDDFLQRELKEEAADVFQTDLAEEFAKEKAETIEKNKPKDVNLLLPGWGSWGGVGVVPSKRKKRRFIIKAPKKVPRRDDNRGFLIINEDAEKKAKEHMVDELPFPFQRVKDFEASIRAPIGRTFVPETAFRKLIKPAVKTKIGTIIEPMDKEVLLKKPGF